MIEKNEKIQNWLLALQEKKEYSLAEMEIAANALVKVLQGGEVFALTAPLGGGKTTLVQMVAKAFGITEPVTSPSFSLYEEYKIGKKLSLFHFDLYRIEKLQEFDLLGFEDFWGKENIISFIEWAERAGDLIPRPYINLFLEFPEKEQNQKRYLYAKLINP